MKQFLSALAFVAFVIGLLAISVTNVSAEDPRPQGIPFSAFPWPTARPLRVGESWSPSISSAPPVVVPPQNPAPAPAASSPSIPLIVLPQNPAPAPANVLPTNNSVPSGGANSSNALNATGSWETLGAGGAVWYRIGSGGVHMDVFLDAEPMSHVTMAVYAPNQLHKPIGHGTPDKDRTRLAWAGGHWQSQGEWLAKITNGNPIPVSYRLTSSTIDISNKSCYSYWEWIGPNYVLWTECR